MEKVKVKNIWSEILCFTWIPAIEAGQTVEIDSILLSWIVNHANIEVVSNANKVKGNEKEKSFKAVDAE